jgi:thymidylate synthase (methanogen type)
MIKVVSALSIFEVYVNAVQYIAWNGQRVPITMRDGKVVNTIEARPVALVIQDIGNEKEVEFLFEASQHSKAFFDEYASGVLNGIPKNNTGKEFDYTYHDRLFQHESTDGRLINQINLAAQNLIDNPSSRQNIAITWQPWIDLSGAIDPPCLQSLHFWQRGGALNMASYWRSRDFFTAVPTNVYAMKRLMEYVASKVQCSLGTYYDYTTIPHIYVTDMDVFNAKSSNFTNILKRLEESRR